MKFYSLFFILFAFACGPAPEPESVTPPEDVPRADPYFPSNIPEGFTLEDYGSVDVLAGESESLTFEATEDDLQFFIALDAEDSGVVVVVLSVIAPDGQEYVVPFTPREDELSDFFLEYPGPATSLNRVFARPRLLSAMVPNTPSLEMQPGTWTFRIGAGTPSGDDEESFELLPFDGSIRVGVVARQTPFIEEGTFDIVMSFDSSSGLDAESAQSDPVVQAALQRIDEVYASVGIRVGAVSYLDIEGPLPDPVDLGPPSCGLGQSEEVFASVEPVVDAVHFVFVGSFTCLRLGGLFDAGANLAAISNGIPGVPFTERGGILVATALKDTLPEDWSFILGHELGHYLGLFHTVEGISEVYDNIDDTLEDDSINYLMHFRTSANPVPQLTPEQGWVLRSHPLVR